MSVKLYPAISFNDGMRWRWNHNGQHYTLRFAGHPVFIVEALFYKLIGGYDKVRFANERRYMAMLLETKDPEEKKKLTSQISKEMLEAYAKAEEMLEAIGTFSASTGKSIFVLYINDIKENGKAKGNSN